MRRRDAIPAWILLAMGAGVLLGAPGSGAAQQDPAVLAGVAFLKSHADAAPGQSAMIALALMKAEVPSTDPAVQRCLRRVLDRFTDSEYIPQMPTGHGTYEAAATAIALATQDASQNHDKLALLASFISRWQNANGSWDYAGRGQGDTSISQYAVLGLWETENAGIDVSPAVWDRAASWFISVQSSAGSWNYHRDDSTLPETCSMTAAGVGSLLICQRQLERYRQIRGGNSPLLTPLMSEGALDYRTSTSPAKIEHAISRGMAWLASNFAVSNVVRVGQQTPYYMLYGFERVGALADRQSLGRIDWYAKGLEFIRSNQQKDGSWIATHGAEMNTVWAILFLTKSTAKTIQRITIKRLGAGTLLGGRELPKDLMSMTVAGGRVVSRPMNGAIEGMLAVLEDPRADQADAAVAGLTEKYYADGPAALKPHKIRFRKMLSDRDPGVRAVAAWGLAHIGDLDVAPFLIDVMVVPNQDEDVVTAARLGLQFLSRKIDGVGPPSPSTAAERQAAAQTWREWYSAIRPLDLEDQDDDAHLATRSPSPAPASSPRRSSPR